MKFNQTIYIIFNWKTSQNPVILHVYLYMAVLVTVQGTILSSVIANLALGGLINRWLIMCDDG